MGRGIGKRGGEGGGDEERQTAVYKINKPQGCIAQHNEYSQYFVITINGV